MDWLKKFGLAQKILGPVEGQGIKLKQKRWEIFNKFCSLLKIAKLLGQFVSKNSKYVSIRSIELRNLVKDLDDFVSFLFGTSHHDLFHDLH